MINSFPGVIFIEMSLQLIHVVLFLFTLRHCNLFIRSNSKQKRFRRTRLHHRHLTHCNNLYCNLNRARKKKSENEELVSEHRPYVRRYILSTSCVIYEDNNNISNSNNASYAHVTYRRSTYARRRGELICGIAPHYNDPPDMNMHTAVQARSVGRSHQCRARKGLNYYDPQIGSLKTRNATHLTCL